MFVPVGQTATSQTSHPTVQRERETKHTTSKSPLLYTIKGQYKPEDLYLSKASTLVTRPKVWVVGTSATLYSPQS